MGNKSSSPKPVKNKNKSQHEIKAQQGQQAKQKTTGNKNNTTTSTANNGRRPTLNQQQSQQLSSPPQPPPSQQQQQVIPDDDYDEGAPIEAAVEEIPDDEPDVANLTAEPVLVPMDDPSIVTTVIFAETIYLSNVEKQHVERLVADGMTETDALQHILSRRETDSAPRGAVTAPNNPSNPNNGMNAQGVGAQVVYPTQPPASAATPVAGAIPTNNNNNNTPLQPTMSMNMGGYPGQSPLMNNPQQQQQQQQQQMQPNQSMYGMQPMNNPNNMYDYSNNNSGNNNMMGQPTLMPPQPSLMPMPNNNNNSPMPMGVSPSFYGGMAPPQAQQAPPQQSMYDMSLSSQQLPQPSMYDMSMAPQMAPQVLPPVQQPQPQPSMYDMSMMNSSMYGAPYPSNTNGSGGNNGYGYGAQPPPLSQPLPPPNNYYYPPQPQPPQPQPQLPPNQSQLIPPMQAYDPNTQGYYPPNYYSSSNNSNSMNSNPNTNFQPAPMPTQYPPLHPNGGGGSGIPYVPMAPARRETLSSRASVSSGDSMSDSGLSQLSGRVKVNDIKKLTKMGFRRDDVIQALLRTNNDVKRSTELLIEWQRGGRR